MDILYSEYTEELSKHYKEVINRKIYILLIHKTLNLLFFFIFRVLLKFNCQKVKTMIAAELSVATVVLF